jgi:hypothetical protein
MRSLLLVLWWLTAMFGSAVYSGFVIATLWEWFVVPSLGLPVLSLPAAYGMGVLASFLSMPTSATDNETVKRNNPSTSSQAGYYIGMSVGRSTLCLAFGFVAHLFM